MALASGQLTRGSDARMAAAGNGMQLTFGTGGAQPGGRKEGTCSGHKKRGAFAPLLVLQLKDELELCVGAITQRMARIGTPVIC